MDSVADGEQPINSTSFSAAHLSSAFLTSGRLRLMAEASVARYIATGNPKTSLSHLDMAISPQAGVSKDKGWYSGSAISDVIFEAGTRFNVQRSTSNDELQKSGVVALNSRTGYTNAMRVSGLLITHQLSEEAAGWFYDLRQVVDELVAFVDEDRADPAVRERLEKLDARIFTTHGPVFYNFDFAEIIGACQGDWVLKVDYDEELSREWHDPRWRQILETEKVSHYWSPRRWITPSGNYLDREPWWPDRQIRLFRKRPEEITFPTKLHETMRMKGEAAYLRTLAIHHHDLRLASRESREEKARSYERERPGNSLGYYYLFEDYDVPETPLPSVSAFDPERELLHMGRLNPDDGKNLSLRISGVPLALETRQLCWLDVALTNDTSQVLCSGAPFPVNLAYHWLEYPSREMIVFDGERTALLPELAPQKTGEWKMFVIAPEKPGTYLLQLTMVQEQVRWLDSQNPDLRQEFKVEVKRS